MLGEISFIVGSIIGPGIFLLPFYLSKYGFSGTLSLLFSAIFFFVLGNYFRKYSCFFELIQKKLGSKLAFFIGWSYWVTSWLSSIVVINEISIYICDLLPLSKYKFIFEIFLLTMLCIINCFGMKNSLLLEIVLSVMKILPLIVMPILFFRGNCTVPLLKFSKTQFIKGILPTVWCFSGIENMGFVKEKKSFIISMTIVTIIYFLNLWSVFCFFGFFDVGPKVYLEIFQTVIGNSQILKTIVLIESISNLNSWILSSGLYAYNLAKSNLMPQYLLKTNNYNSPQRAILVGGFGLLGLIFLCQSTQAAQMITQFTNISCNLFLLFYFCFVFCCFLEEKTATTFFMSIILMVIFITSQNLFSLFCIFLIMMSGFVVFDKEIKVIQNQ